jgi:uncharacterized protein DUF5947
VSERPAVLQILRKRPDAVPITERCEFCGAGIDDRHGHLVDLPRRALLCVCRPCYLLFTHDGAGGARFRAVPERYQSLAPFPAPRDAWDALDVPIGLAFFFTNGLTGRTTGFYPSPAGATESELPLDAWLDLVRAVPPLSALAPDVEALLVKRSADGIDALIVPIDACYELVGRIRRSWRGIQGGDEVAREVDEFFTRAFERARRSAA